MSNTATGIICDVSTFNFQGTDLYSFQLQGDKRYFRTGDSPVGFNVGDCVEFCFNVKGRNHNVDRKTLKAAAAAPAAPAQQAPGTRTAASGQRQSGGTSAKDTYWQDKEAYQKDVVEPRIGFQASRSQAIELVSAALTAGALSLGSAKGKQLDRILDYVDQVTDRFFLKAQHAQEHIKTLEETAVSVGNVETISDDVDYDDE